MKQEQVNAFCRRQHEEGRTVDALWMCAPDLQELAVEALGGQPPEFTFTGSAPTESVQAGILVTEFRNPATGVVMPVGLMPEGGEPMACVRAAPGTRSFLVPVS